LVAYRIPKRYQEPELRLLAAILSGAQHPQQVPDEQWLRLLSVAHQHNLLSMLLWVVKRDAPELVVGELWEAAFTSVRKNALRHIWLEQTQRQVNRAFNEAGIAAIWLKGIALAVTVFPQPALRPMADLDVLVPYADREAALKIAESLGFEFDAPPSFVETALKDTKQDYHYRLTGGITGDIYLEIHYRLINEGETPHTFDKEGWFFSQVDTSIENLPILKPDALLLHLCAHIVVHHGEETAVLSQFHDVHRVLTNAAIDWAFLVEWAVNLHWSYIVEYALTITESLFHSPIPAGVLDQLRARRLPDENILRILTLQGRGANLEFALGLMRALSLVDQFRLLRQFIFPPRAYMLKRYSITSDHRVWMYYPRRWFSQVLVVGGWLRQRATWQRGLRK